MNKKIKSIQDQYLHPGTLCFGCGRDNEHGLHIKSYLDGEELVCEFLPHDHHVAYPGFMNGGVIATIIDCHSIGMAVAHAYKLEGRKISEPPFIPFVTGSIHIDFIKPTPLNGKPLILRASIAEHYERKTLVKCSLHSKNIITARGETLAIRMKDSL